MSACLPAEEQFPRQLRDEGIVLTLNRIWPDVEFLPLPGGEPDEPNPHEIIPTFRQ